MDFPKQIGVEATTGPGEAKGTSIEKTKESGGFWEENGGGGSH